MSVTVKIEGLRELDQALQELTKATGRNQMRGALKDGGKVFADKWEAIAPQDQGHLADSIAVGTKLTKSQRRKHQKRDEVEVFVGSDDPAAMQQEFGNVNHPPQPSVRPAWESSKGEVLDTIARKLGERVDKAVARARQKALKNAR